MIEPLARVLSMLHCFEKILTLVESGFEFLSKMKYILWVVALLEGLNVTKHGRHVGRHLEFCPELEIR